MFAERSRNTQIAYQITKTRFLLWVSHASVTAKLLIILAVLGTVVMIGVVLFDAVRLLLL